MVSVLTWWFISSLYRSNFIGCLQKDSLFAYICNCDNMKFSSCLLCLKLHMDLNYAITLFVASATSPSLNGRRPRTSSQPPVPVTKKKMKKKKTIDGDTGCMYTVSFILLKNVVITGVVVNSENRCHGLWTLWPVAI